MRASGEFRILCAAVSLAACVPHGAGTPPDAVASRDTGSAPAGSRWYVAFGSAAGQGSGVLMDGWVSMARGERRDNTPVTLGLSHASPGATHPWQLHHGRCSADQGLFGPASAYAPVTVDARGSASGHATVRMPLPTEGPLFVRVAASPAAPETTIACGDLVTAP